MWDGPSVRHKTSSDADQNQGGFMCLQWLLSRELRLHGKWCVPRSPLEKGGSEIVGSIDIVQSIPRSLPNIWNVFRGNGESLHTEELRVRSTSKRFIAAGC